MYYEDPFLLWILPLHASRVCSGIFLRKISCGNTPLSLVAFTKIEHFSGISPPERLTLFGESAVHLFVQVYAARACGSELVVTPAGGELARLADVNGALVVRGVDVLNRIRRRVGFEFGVFVSLAEGAFGLVVVWHRRLPPGSGLKVTTPAR